jgi:hypothetical protein
VSYPKLYVASHIFSFKYHYLSLLLNTGKGVIVFFSIDLSPEVYLVHYYFAIISYL